MMRRNGTRIVWSLLALVLIGTSGAALAQADSADSANQSPLPGVFGEIVDVRVVNIEVVVTDKRGVPIAGLSPGDFQLVVDGEEAEIEYFTEVVDGVAAKGRLAEEPTLSVPSVSPGEAVGTSYLIFIDEFFSERRDRDRVLASLRQSLSVLGPNDRVAVVAYDGDDLSMLSTWSGSQAVLDSVFEQAAARPTHGIQRIFERREVRADLALTVSQANAIGDDSARLSDFGGLTPFERSYVRRLTDQVARSVFAAAATLRSFANPPGRKVMLVLSGGWPYLPASSVVDDRINAGELGFTAIGSIYLDSDGPRGPVLFRPLVDAANLLGYTLYPVDVPGFSPDFDSSVDVAGRVAAGQFADGGFQREAGLHDSLRFLARETGGQALINSERLGALETVAADVRSYYWIGFSPDRQWDDARHSIDVKVRGPGMELRSRSSFLDSSRTREATMAVESSLLFGNAPSDKTIPVRIGKSQKAGRRYMTVPLTVLVPMNEVTVIPVGDEYVADLEIRIALEDERGRRSDIPVIPVHVRLDRAPEGNGHASYETTLRLRRQRHDAIIALYDPVGGTMMASRVKILP